MSSNYSSEFPIRGFPVDGPLLLNGKETGRIRCSIEGWWMNDFAARLAGAGGFGGVPQQTGTVASNEREFVTVRSNEQIFTNNRNPDNGGHKQGGRKWGFLRGKGDEVSA